MSHFSVVVIVPPGRRLDELLAPFHEFECTGVDDEHVQTIDLTDETRQEYESRETTMYEDPDGMRHEYGSDLLYAEPTPEELEKIGPVRGSGIANGVPYVLKDWGDGLPRRVKVRRLPAGWKEVKVPTRELMSFAEHVEDWNGYKPVPHGEKPDLEGRHKYGYYTLDENLTVTGVFDRTNPNKKWNWWVIGGRYTGFFRHKLDVILGKVWQPGLMTPAADPSSRSDVLYKKDVDFAAMQDEREERARRHFALIAEHLTLRDFEGFRPFKAFFDEIGTTYADRDAAVRAYDESSPVTARWNELVRGDGPLRDVFGFFGQPGEAFDILKMGLEEFVRRERRRAGVPYALIVVGEDGKPVWLQKGEMGWWGFSKDDMTQEDWNEAVWKIYDETPDGDVFVAVDCHI